MSGIKAFAAATVLSTLVSTSFALNTDLTTNVAVYYGQGAYQPRLRHFCEQTSMDIINLGFITTFPEAPGEWPGSNFGNQCDGTYYTGTGLLSGCHQIWEDIPYCQDMGKTVLLSLGGDSSHPRPLDNETAKWFADFLWYSFGPYNADALASGLYARPFQDVSVDGFDFDIEHNGGSGYATMINRLRYRFKEYSDRKFYISGAPQCQIPDEQLGWAINHTAFDFIWVQFYNTDGCSAANYANGTGHFNYDEWVNVIKTSGNPEAKLFVGLPGSPTAAVDGFYISPTQVKSLVEEYMGRYPDTFGGIMLWEATAAENNTIGNVDYTQSMKYILDECAPPPPPQTSITSSSTATVVPISTSPPSSSVAHSSSPVILSGPAHSSTVSSSSSLTSSSATAASPSINTGSRPVVPISQISSSSIAFSSTPHVPSMSTSASSLAISSTIAGVSSTRPTASGSVKTSTTPSTSSIPISSPVVSSSLVRVSSIQPSVASGSASTKGSSSSIGSTSSGSVAIGKPSGTSSSPWMSTHASGSTSVQHTHSTVPHGSSSASESRSSSARSTQTPSDSLRPSSSVSVSATTRRTTSTPLHVSSSGSSTAPTTVSTLPPSSRGPSRTRITRTPLSSSTGTPVLSTKSSVTLSASSVASVSSSTFSNIGAHSSSSSEYSVSTTFPTATDAGQHTTATSTGTGSAGTWSTGNGSTGAGPTGAGSTGAESTTITYLVTPTPVWTSSPSLSAPETITTVIVTSYTSICPTGFTTITTTMTSYICPQQTSVTATATDSISGETTASASIPEGWTTTVTVCTQCAATPTTVTLTLPKPTTAMETASPLSAYALNTLTTTPETWTETWTTTVTFCKHCGVTGSSITLTVPYTPSTSISTATSTALGGERNGEGAGTVLSDYPKPITTSSAWVLPDYTSSENIGVLTVGIPTGNGVSVTQAPSSFMIHPSASSTTPSSSPAPSGTPEDAVPTFNGASGSAGMIGFSSFALAILVSAALLM